ncbi:hypothetical protein XENORESO_016392, partial [Xenotaenia resolanae]
LVSISSGLRARGGVHPGQFASPSQGNKATHGTNDYANTRSKGNLARPINLSHVFGLWEEAGVLGENPLMHGENMQTPRKTRGRESNLGLSCCKATVLQTVPPCSPYIKDICQNAFSFTC